MNAFSINGQNKDGFIIQDNNVQFEDNRDLMIANPNDSASFDDKTQKENNGVAYQYQTEISNIILNDQIEDGIISASELYIKAIYNDKNGEYIKIALMNLYLNNLDDCKILEGVLVMISSISYIDSCPQGPIMAMGLLQNKNDSVRDMAIQAFERWNSKKALPVLESLRCDKEWLQNYVGKVILYIKKDGID